MLHMDGRPSTEEPARGKTAAAAAAGAAGGAAAGAAGEPLVENQAGVLSKELKLPPTRRFFLTTNQEVLQ